MKIKKIVALLITLAMCIGLLTVPVMAEGDAWDGTTVDTDWYTNNTEATEFTLSTGAELAGLAQLVNGGNSFEGKTIKLDADIDLNNQEWTPIGGNGEANVEAGSFWGIFDGDNHTIKNLKVTESSDKFIGLFGFVKRKGTDDGNFDNFYNIKDLIIENAYVYGNGDESLEQYAGALAGDLWVACVQNITIKGSIQIYGFEAAGGVAGSEHYGYRYENLTVQGTEGSYVKTGNDKAGGIFGFTSNFAPASEFNKLSVSGIKVESKRKVGGVLGAAYTASKISNVTVNNVTVTTYADETFANQKKKDMGIGGVVGLYYTDDKVTSGDVSKGSIDNVAVSNITLETTNEIEASFGYITGGLYNATNLPGDMTDAITSSNITVNGTNSGENNNYLYNLADILYVDAYVDSQDKGNIRFITKVNSDDEVTEYGTYFVLEKDIANIQQSDVKLEGSSTGKKTTFSADIMGVPNSELNTPIYAISFIKIGDSAVWSPVKGASVDEYNHNKEVNE